MGSGYYTAIQLPSFSELGNNAHRPRNPHLFPIFRHQWYQWSNFSNRRGVAFQGCHRKPQAAVANLRVWQSTVAGGGASENRMWPPGEFAAAMVEWWLNGILYLLSPKIQWKKPMFYLHLFAWNDYNDSPTRLDVLLILPFVGPCEKHTVHQFYPWDPLSAYFTGSISKSKHIETKGPNPRFSAEYGPSGFTTWKSPFVSPGIWQMMIRSSASNGMNVMLESGSTNTIWILCKKSRSTNHWRRWLMYEKYEHDSITANRLKCRWLVITCQISNITQHAPSRESLSSVLFGKSSNSLGRHLSCRQRIFPITRIPKYISTQKLNNSIQNLNQYMTWMFEILIQLSFRLSHVSWI